MTLPPFLAELPLALPKPVYCRLYESQIPPLLPRIPQSNALGVLGALVPLADLGGTA